MPIPYDKVSTPAFVLDERLLRRNLEIIQRVQKEAGVEIILAFKGFAMWSAFPIVKEYINGATASSLHEAMLCHDEMGVKAHTYCVGFKQEEFDDILKISSHITFNSLNQFNQFKEQIADYKDNISVGIRVNPEFSDVTTDLYNPASPYSRLGEVIENFEGKLPEEIDGLHFHVLCESTSYALQQVLEHLEEKFGQFFKQLKWINMGGGHLMTRKDYDVEHLIKVLKEFKAKHNIQVILEPGSAFAWETGDLVSSVVDVVERRGVKTIIIDASFTAHMPDTLEMPYRPKIVGATDPVEGKSSYRIGGTSCLAGDYLDEYSFDNEVNPGDLIIFKDMIHYTMVKTTTFNGVKHPDICIFTIEDELKVIRRFNYLDFKNRLS